jgi:hypothetical protein
MVAPEHLTASKPPRLAFHFLLRTGLPSLAAFPVSQAGSPVFLASEFRLLGAKPSTLALEISRPTPGWATFDHFGPLREYNPVPSPSQAENGQNQPFAVRRCGKFK